jgi:WD40 repeat protein
VRKELCAIYEELFGNPSPWAELPEVSLEADGWNNRGITYLDLGREGKARECFGRALEANPVHLEATYNNALLEWRKAEIDDMEVLGRLRRLADISENKKRELTLAIAEVYQEHFDPAAALAELSLYPGMYAELFAAESSQTALLDTLAGHSQAVWAVALTPDRRWALSGSADRTIKLWDLDVKKCVRTLEQPWAISLALTPDGRLAVSTDWSSLRIWDLRSGQCLHTIDTREPVSSLAVAANGQSAVSVTSRDARWWNVETGQCLRKLKVPKGMGNRVALTSDGRLALLASNRTLTVWDLEVGRCRYIKTDSDVRAVALCADGQLSLSGDDQGIIKLWNLETGNCIRIFVGHSSGISALAVCSESRLLISASTDRSLKIWAIDTGRCLRTLTGHSGSVWAVAIDGKGQHAVSGGEEGNVKLWSLNVTTCRGGKSKLCPPRQLNILRMEDDAIREATSAIEALYDAGRYVDAYRLLLETWGKIGYRSDRRLDALYARLQEAGNIGYLLSAVERELVDVNESGRMVAAMTPDGQRALSAGRVLRFWDLETSKVLRELPDDALAVALTPDGKRALAGARDGTVRLWELQSGKCLRTWRWYPRYKAMAWTSVAVSRDGNRALSASSNTILTLWDLQTGHRLREFKGGGSGVDAVALSPDGRWGLSGGSGVKPLKLWDMNTGTCQQVLPEGYDHLIVALAFTPDGRRALAGGLQRSGGRGSLKLWDLETGQTVYALEGHTNCVLTVTCTSDGRRALSAGVDKTIRLWDLETGRCLQTLPVGFVLRSFAVTADARRGLSNGKKSVAVWRLIWSLDFPVQ